jgi:hypothetical protein
MKIHKKAIFIGLILWIFAAVPVFSQTQQIDAIKSSVETFSEKMALALPFNSTIGLNWSDSYIGMFTSIPPHLGIGVTAGFTTIDFDSINKLLGAFGQQLPSIDSLSFIEDTGFPLPGYTIDARIGGLILPFDVGIKFGYIPQNALNRLFEDINLSQMLIGADIRYALVISKVLPLRLSVGAGFNFLQGKISTSIPAGRSFQFDSYGITNTITLDDPDLAIEWRTTTVELKAQVTLPYKFFTPYLGVGAGYAWTQSGYKVSAPNLYVNGGSISDEQKKLLEDYYGLTDVSEKGFETINKYHNFMLRSFGGVSINLFYVRLDLTAMYEVMGRKFGATVGLRFQL